MVAERALVATLCSSHVFANITQGGFSMLAFLEARGGSLG